MAGATRPGSTEKRGLRPPFFVVVLNREIVDNRFTVKQLRRNMSAFDRRSEGAKKLCEAAYAVRMKSLDIETDFGQVEWFVRQMQNKINDTIDGSSVVLQDLQHHYDFISSEDRDYVIGAIERTKESLKASIQTLQTLTVTVRSYQENAYAE